MKSDKGLAHTPIRSSISYHFIHSMSILDMIIPRMLLEHLHLPVPGERGKRSVAVLSSRAPFKSTRGVKEGDNNCMTAWAPLAVVFLSTAPSGPPECCLCPAKSGASMARGSVCLSISCHAIYSKKKSENGTPNLPATRPGGRRESLLYARSCLLTVNRGAASCCLALHGSESLRGLHGCDYPVS